MDRQNVVENDSFDSLEETYDYVSGVVTTNNNGMSVATVTNLDRQSEKHYVSIPCPPK